jgi:hypothetical protein
MCFRNCHFKKKSDSEADECEHDDDGGGGGGGGCDDDDDNNNYITSTTAKGVRRALALVCIQVCDERAAQLQQLERCGKSYRNRRKSDSK